MKRYDIFDLLKIILSFMVVAIHTELLPNILYPWLRLAVPLFFLISSYLLYTKIKNNPSENKKTIITNYIFRLLKMYLFWFIALIPFTIYVRRHWFDNGLTIGILNVILKPFMGSTFIASWYITASIIGTIIVDKLLSKVNYRILIVLFLIAYLICCCASSYSFLFQKISFLSIQEKYAIILEPHYSFMVSLIYILFGKIICENKLRINRKTNLVLIILCSILLYIEWRIVWNLTEKNNYDCYLMIAPLCILFFNYIKSININIKNPKFLRQLSSFIYPLHASLAKMISIILEGNISNYKIECILNFIFTLLICIIFFFIVKKLEKRIKVLKYSY